MHGNVRVDVRSDDGLTLIAEGVVELGSARKILYTVYDVYNTINRDINLDIDRDFITKLREGTLGVKDERLDKMRESLDKETPYTFFLTEKDNSWFSQTKAAAFALLEAKLLPKLKDEIKHRVDERKVGLADILSV